MAAQGLGVGKSLVTASEAISKEMGFLALHLDARQTAVKFYLSLGYEIEGELFEKVTLPHLKMRKMLA